MSTSSEDKERIIGQLNFLLSKFHRTIFRLKRAGKDDEANLVHANAHELSDLIDRLLAESMSTWNVNANEKITTLRKASAALQRAIKNIKDGIRVAQNTVRALKIVDDILGIVTEVAAAIA